jgi:hypothetical protein
LEPKDIAENILLVVLGIAFVFVAIVAIVQAVGTQVKGTQQNVCNHCHPDEWGRRL